jgi:protein SCO1/2
VKKINPFYFIYLFAFVAVLGFGAWKLLLDKKPAMLLPYYGELNPDSSYHTIPPFQFTDQLARAVTQHTFDGDIYVVDFFFTHCPSVCPTMSANLESLAKKFKDEPTLKILSHTVDPLRDSVPVLLRYAVKHQANPNQWYFVTGTKKDLYDIARNGYLLSATQGDGGENDFVHTQNIALIDKEKHIRGFYNGIDNKEMVKLSADISLLLEEYKWRNKRQ